jgi:hypothetical protein
LTYNFIRWPSAGALASDYGLVPPAGRSALVLDTTRHPSAKWLPRITRIDGVGSQVA